MENTIKTNQWAMVITALLYLTFWGGILSQIVLGLFHIIVFLRLLKKWKNISKKNKIRLKIYGIVTATLLFNTFSFPEPFIGILWIGSFALIIYFAFILKQLKTLELWN